MLQVAGGSHQELGPTSQGQHLRGDDLTEPLTHVFVVFHVDQDADQVSYSMRAIFLDEDSAERLCLEKNTAAERLADWPLNAGEGYEVAKIPVGVFGEWPEDREGANDLTDG